MMVYCFFVCEFIGVIFVELVFGCFINFFIDLIFGIFIFEINEIYVLEYLE